MAINGVSFILSLSPSQFDWCIWPPTQYVNFVYVPAKYRVSYVNAITVVWDIFLSYMKHFDELGKEDGGGGGDEKPAAVKGGTVLVNAVELAKEEGGGGGGDGKAAAVRSGRTNFTSRTAECAE